MLNLPTAPLPMYGRSSLPSSRWLQPSVALLWVVDMHGSTLTRRVYGRLGFPAVRRLTTLSRAPYVGGHDVVGRFRPNFRTDSFSRPV
jgi:hypothetical protein